MYPMRIFDEVLQVENHPTEIARGPASSPAVNMPPGSSSRLHSGGAEGMGYRRIAALLSLGGIAAPRGGTWQANQVRRIWRLAASESLQYVLPMKES